MSGKNRKAFYEKKVKCFNICTPGREREQEREREKEAFDFTHFV